MKITRINHSAINSHSRLREMTHFYSDVLGITTVKRDLPEQYDALIPGFWMQFPNGQIHVIEHNPSAKASGMLDQINHTNCDPMGPHTAFYVENIDRAEQHLAAQGVAYDRVAGFIFTCDPAGNTVEFQQDPDMP